MSELKIKIQQIKTDADYYEAKALLSVMRETFNDLFDELEDELMASLKRL